MHFHLPKPLHGWREFGGEVGIIVIGVLIALGAEQLVEALQWKAKAREAQTTIDAELGLTAGVFDVRGMMAPCEKQRLAQVLSVIAKARQSGQLPDVKGVAGGVTAPIVTTAWEGALSEGAVSHFAQKRRQEYAGLYNALGLYRSVMDEERRLYAHLRLVQNSPGKISDALLAEIATSNAELRDRTRLGDTIAEQGLVQMRQLGIKADYGYFTGAPGTLGHGTRVEVRRGLVATGQAEPHCTPVLANGSPVVVQSPE